MTQAAALSQQHGRSVLQDPGLVHPIDQTAVSMALARYRVQLEAFRRRLAATRSAPTPEPAILSVVALVKCDWEALLCWTDA
jgi:hypothetical protein